MRKKYIYIIESVANSIGGQAHQERRNNVGSHSVPHRLKQERYS